MPSTFTTNLNLEKPLTGEQAGSWGETVNANMDAVDAAIDGSITITVPLTLDAQHPIHLGSNIGDPGLHKVINFVGTLAATGYVQIIPGNAQRIYMVINNCTDRAGAGHQYDLIFQQGDAATGHTYSLPMGRSAI